MLDIVSTFRQVSTKSGQAQTSNSGSIIGNHFAGPNGNGGILMAPSQGGMVHNWHISGNNFLGIGVPPISLVGSGVKGILIGQNGYVECPFPFVDDQSGSPAGPSWDNYFLLEDEFLTGGTASNQIGDWGWSLGLGGGTVVAEFGEANHPGIIRLQTSTTSSNVARIGARSAGELVSDFSYFGAIVRDETAAGTANMSVRVGLMDTPGGSGEASQGLYWSYLSSTNTHWRTVTKDLGGAEVNQTTKPQHVYTTARWCLLEIIRNGDSWEFWFNRVLLFTHTMNIPLTAHLVPAIAIETNENARKEIDIDYAAIRTRNRMGQRWTP